MRANQRVVSSRPLLSAGTEGLTVFESLANQYSDVRANANAGLDTRGTRDLPLANSEGYPADALSATPGSSRPPSTR